MSFPEQPVTPREVDKRSDNADAFRMGRWVVGIAALLVAAMLSYDYTRYSTMANVAPASYPSTTGTLPASHKVSPSLSLLGAEPM